MQTTKHNYFNEMSLLKKELARPHDGAETFSVKFSPKISCFAILKILSYGVESISSLFQSITARFGYWFRNYHLILKSMEKMKR